LKVNRASERPADRRDADGSAPRTSRGELRRAALLQAAREVFLEQGYEGASIEEIVSRVGGSKASLYSYFGSKQGLFWEVAALLTDEFVSELAVPTAADADVASTLHSFGLRFLRGYLDPAGCRLLRTMIAEAQRFPDLAQRFFEHGPQRTRKVLSDYLGLQHTAGRLECPDPQTAATQFIELVKGAPHSRVLLSVPPFSAGFNPDKHVAGAVRLFLYGCARR
jgi:AcrR family transcriptional regulator